MRKKSKRPTVILLSIITVILVYCYFIFGEKKVAPIVPKTEVTVTKATFGEIYDSVEALGTSLANESVEITPNITEVVEKVNFTDNQFVKKGEVIVVLQHKEELAQKKAEELQLREHKRELERLGLLVKKQAATKQKYDERKTLVQISEQKISEIQATIDDRIIKAPFDGILGLKNISVGSVVRPGDIITTIDDISLIKIDFPVPATYLPDLKPQMPIIVTSEVFPDKEFIGEVSFIDSRVDVVTRSIMVRAVIKNKDFTLKPGLLMHINLIRNKRSAILIAEEALIPKQDKNFVFIVGPDNKIVEKEVVIGTRKPGFVEVKSGLKDGDLVVIRGLTRVAPGEEVVVSLPKVDH